MIRFTQPKTKMSSVSASGAEIVGIAEDCDGCAAFGISITVLHLGHRPCLPAFSEAT